jgi:hypothetical protein
MGPNRQGSQRSLSSGPDLPETPPTYKWAQRPYPQPGDLDNLIQTPEDQSGLWRKFLPWIVVRCRQ